MTIDHASPIPQATFETRRSAASARLGRGVMVLPAAPIQHSSRDTELAYCPDRELYYLTGVTEPGSVAVLVGGSEPRLVLFVRERDPDAELWTGPRLGPDAAKELHGADECYGLSELETRLPELLGAADRIFFRMGRGSLVERLVSAGLERARAKGSRTGSGPRGIIDPGEVIDDLRLIKDEHELKAIRQACVISSLGHRAGAGAIAPGVGEWAVEAAVDGAFRAAGAKGTAFETIVASGSNGCVLHYVDNSDVVGNDSVVLVDAGAEFGMYHGDITRSYPASGSFTARQRAVYEVVEAALRAGVAATKPGAAIADVHDAAVRVLVLGLADLGAVKGNGDDLLAEGAHEPFFPHQTSHWLGLDVHDPGDYARDGESRILEPGMVFTIEPGLYFRPGSSEGAAEAFSGIGIRIEDDVAVTASGCEVLTAALPTKASDVESMVGAGS
jgi:Xaa-Pro aminopeptidase